MNEAKRRFLLGGLKVFDISQMILSFGLATILVVHWDQRVGLEQFLSIRVKLSNCVTFGSILCTVVVCASGFLCSDRPAPL